MIVYDERYKYVRGRASDNNILTSGCDYSGLARFSGGDGDGEYPRGES